MRHQKQGRRGGKRFSWVVLSAASRSFPLRAVCRTIQQRAEAPRWKAKLPRFPSHLPPSGASPHRSLRGILAGLRCLESPMTGILLCFTGLHLHLTFALSPVQVLCYLGDFWVAPAWHFSQLLLLPCWLGPVQPRRNMSGARSPGSCMENALRSGDRFPS